MPISRLSEYSTCLRSLQNPEALSRIRKQLNRDESNPDGGISKFMTYDLFSRGNSYSSSLPSAATSRRSSFSTTAANKGQMNEAEALKAHIIETQRYGEHFKAYLDLANEVARLNAQIRDDEALAASEVKKHTSMSVAPRDVMPYDVNAWEWQDWNPMQTNISTPPPPTSASTSQLSVTRPLVIVSTPPSATRSPPASAPSGASLPKAVRKGGGRHATRTVRAPIRHQELSQSPKHRTVAAGRVVKAQGATTSKLPQQKLEVPSDSNCRKLRYYMSSDAETYH